MIVFYTAYYSNLLLGKLLKLLDYFLNTQVLRMLSVYFKVLTSACSRNANSHSADFFVREFLSNYSASQIRSLELHHLMPSLTHSLVGLVAFQSLS